MEQVKQLRETLLDFKFTEEEQKQLDDRGQISGMLGEYAGCVLYNASKTVKNSIVEVGCFKGKSTSFLALSGKEVFTIDPFAIDLNLQYIFRETIEKFKMTNVIHILGHAESVSLDFLVDKKIDLFFYDGDHDTELTVSTIKRYESFFVKDCLVILDDVTTGPVKAALKILGEDKDYQEIFCSSGNGKEWHQGICVLQYGRSTDD